MKTLSSIPNISTVGTWKRCAQGTTTPSQQTGSLTPTQENQTIALTGLTDDGTYDCIITFKDNTGWSSNQNRTVTIGQNSPVFFVNKYGIGVNGYKAHTHRALNVNGSGFINGNFGQCGGSVDTGKNFNDFLTEGEFLVSGADTLANAPYTGSIYGKLIVKVSDGGTHNNSNNWIWQEFRSTSNGAKTYRRSKTNSSAWTSWYRDYNTENKPTKSDVGLGNVANYGNSSTITSNSTTTYATTSMVAKVRAEKLSHTTSVWGGITLTRADDVSGCSITFKNNAFVLGVCGFASEKEFVVRAGTATTNLLKIDSTGTMDVYNGARIAGAGGLTVTGNLSSANYRSGGATRITSLNGRLATGLYSWTSGASGAPTSYGTLINIQWTEAGDIYQLALGSAGQLWTRVFLNGSWGSWALK